MTLQRKVHGSYYYIEKYLNILSWGIKKLNNLKEERMKENGRAQNARFQLNSTVNKPVNPKYKIHCVRELHALCCTDGCAWQYCTLRHTSNFVSCTSEDLQRLVIFQQCHKLIVSDINSARNENKQIKSNKSKGL